MESSVVVFPPRVFRVVLLIVTSGLRFAIRAVYRTALRAARFVDLLDDATKLVGQLRESPCRGVSGDGLVDIEPGKQVGALPCPHLSNGLFAVVEVGGGDAVDGSFDPSALGIVVEAGIDAGGAEGGEAVSRVPSVVGGVGCIGDVLFAGQVSVVVVSQVVGLSLNRDLRHAVGVVVGCRERAVLSQATVLQFLAGDVALGVVCKVELVDQRGTVLVLYLRETAGIVVDVGLDDGSGQGLLRQPPGCVVLIAGSLAPVLNLGELVGFVVAVLRFVGAVDLSRYSAVEGVVLVFDAVETIRGVLHFARQAVGGVVFVLESCTAFLYLNQSSGGVVAVIRGAVGSCYLDEPVLAVVGIGDDFAFAGGGLGEAVGYVVLVGFLLVESVGF